MEMCLIAKFPHGYFVNGRVSCKSPHLYDGEQSLLGTPHHLHRLLAASAHSNESRPIRRFDEQKLLRLKQYNVVHRHLLKTPSTPVVPIPSTMSLDNLKGTVSGVGRILPCSKATPAHTEENKEETALNLAEV